MFGSRRLQPAQDERTLKGAATETVSVRPVFSITEIEGIEDVLNAVRVSVIGGVTAPRRENSIRAAVLPHHTLAGPKLMELWSDIEAGSDPSVIVVIGPNHENAGEGMVQTTHGVWTSPFGVVETDDGLVDRLVSLGVATEESDSFVNEHAIGTHVSYLADLFPDIPIVPIIAKSPAGADDALSLVLVLQQILPDDALIISSIDFSHYLPEDTTDAMDAETLAHIAARRYTEIERLHSDHLDAPYAMIAYLLWNDRNGYAADLVWHETSHRLLGDPNAPGTSYLVFFSSITSTTSTPSITLSLVGDLMLGRGVESALSRTTVPSAFAAARSVLNTNVAYETFVFGNLESVVTVVEPPTGKEIYFKADPAIAISALQEMGFTHLSVANNHVDDYGYAGWEESVGHLVDAGIVPVGNYANQPAVASSEITKTTRSGIKQNILFLAYDDTYRPVDVEQLVADIALSDAVGDVLVVSFHWGVEYQHTPTSRQQTLAHAAIDAGADIVVGHHPHVLQGIETYNDGLILYSLGNFVFDQIGEDENESVVARLSLPLDKGEAGGGSRVLELVPMRIVGTFPRVATNEERLATFGRVVQWSEMEFPEDFATVGTLVW